LTVSRVGLALIKSIFQRLSFKKSEKDKNKDIYKKN